MHAITLPAAMTNTSHRTQWPLIQHGDTMPPLFQNLFQRQIGPVAKHDQLVGQNEIPLDMAARPAHRFDGGAN